MFLRHGQRSASNKINVTRRETCHASLLLARVRLEEIESIMGQNKCEASQLQEEMKSSR